MLKKILLKLKTMKPCKWHIVIVAMLILISCNKAPNGIIKESDMVDLLVDLHKADAYVDNYPTQFPDDSTRMALKQSVFLKHGVTQADFDTSLVWYAHNIDVYTDVYRHTIDKLKNEFNKASNDKSIPKRTDDSNEGLAIGKTYYTIEGDTADLWNMPREWILTQGMNTGFIPFDYNPDNAGKRGDCYELKYKTIIGQNKISSFIAVDYSDGGTAYLSHSYSSKNWNILSLQTDNTRSVRRIYGYFFYKLLSGETACIDSVQLLRTHMESDNYNSRFSAQHVVERMVKRNVKASGNESVSMKPIHHESFRPKDGLHKSSVNSHIEVSPNASHLPSRR